VLRTQRFCLVLTQAEREATKQLAELEGGLSQAALVRRLIRSEAQRRELRISFADASRYKERVG